MSEIRTPDDWNHLIATVKIAMTPQLRFFAQVDPRARDGISVTAWCNVRDRDIEREVNAVVVDFPPVCADEREAALFLRALAAKLLVHELDESMTVNGKRVRDAHFEPPIEAQVGRMR